MKHARILHIPPDGSKQELDLIIEDTNEIKSPDGKVLADFSEININSLSNKDSLIIGVIIENKATRLMRFFKKTSDSYGDYNYNAEEIEMNLDDFIHTYLDHDLMYKRFDVIGQEIIHFLGKGIFSDNAKREKYNWDPFKKLKKNDINL